MDATMLSLVGCIIAFALLMILIMKNLHILIVALVCVTVVSLFSGMNLYPPSPLYCYMFLSLKLHLRVPQDKKVLRHLFSFQSRNWPTTSHFLRREWSPGEKRC